MNICVTGGTGYVGKYLSQYLESTGHDVTVTIRSEKSKIVAEKLNLNYIKGDLNDLDNLIPKITDFEIIIHCAFDYSIEFKKSIELDYNFLIRLFQSKPTNLRQFIYTSTAYALLHDKNEFYDESIDIKSLPNSDKWIFKHENMVNKACNNTLKTAVIRAGMVYGGFGGTMDSFFNEAYNSDSLDMPGEGHNFWSFIHVKDLANLYLKILQNNATGIFHGIDSKPLKVVDVFNAINSVCSTDARLNILKDKKAQAKYGLYYKTLLSDIRVISKRMSEINWKPEKPDFITSIQTAFNEWRNKKLIL